MSFLSPFSPLYHLARKWKEIAGELIPFLFPAAYIPEELPFAECESCFPKR
jgi:hypothetical protein